jgi:3-deoxy-manno-octulosonate cytidylyltransferase (CMP-KDO synthetase)
VKTVCVIPSRFGSTRLPGKPLVPLKGRPMIQWVCLLAKGVPVFDEVLVATDDARIADACAAVGVEGVMTDPDLPSGSDRIHAALRGRSADIVVNLQGDEPAMPVEAITRAHRALVATPAASVSTACVPIFEREAFDAPHVVKVVRGDGERALYFSRSPIPSPVRRTEPDLGTGTPWGHKHLGLYVYRRAALERFVTMPPGALERIESLEQLRMLAAGMTILCVESPADSVGVDVAEDVARAESMLP